MQKQWVEYMTDWKEVTLGEVCEKIGSGATPTGGGNSYKKTGISLIRSQNVLDYSFSENGLAYIDDEQADKLRNVIVKVNDILLNITGDSVARCCIVPQQYLPARVNQHVSIIRCNFEYSEYRYLLYYLLHNKLELLSLSGAGATRNALTKSMIENLKITLPPLAEQKAIADILSCLDDKIELNNAINKNLEEQAQAIFKSWFIDFEPFKYGEFEDSELGKIPKGWRVEKLGNIVDTKSGGTPSRKRLDYYENGTVDWVKSKELNRGFILETEEKITEEAIKKSSAKKLKQNSVLLAMYGATVGEYALLSKEMTCNQAICVIEPNDKVPYTFLYMWVKNQQRNIINLAVGSAQQNISQVLIKTINIAYSEITILKYHALVEHLFEKIKLNQMQTQQLTKIRDALLPKLISGEIRIPVEVE